MTEYGLRSRTNRQTLFQLLAARLSYPRQLRIKSFNMLFFLLEKALWNKHGEIGVTVSCFLETTIQLIFEYAPKFQSPPDETRYIRVPANNPLVLLF